MLRNQHMFCRSSELINQQVRRIEEEHVGIQISHPLHTRVTIKNELRGKGGKRPTILTTTACGFDRKQPVVFHLAQRNQTHMRQCQLMHMTLYQLIHAQNPQVKRLAMFKQ